MQIVGLIILAIVVIIVLNLRKRIDQSDNTFLKNAQKVGDVLAWGRFIIFIIFAVFIIFVFKVVGK